MSDNVFTPGRIGSLILKNRVIKAACFEGMSQNGGITPNLADHHCGMASGGVAMTTVAYCSIRKDGRAYAHEMWMRESLVPDLKKMTERVHQEGAAVAIQLGHCGYFASRRVTGQRAQGASRKFNLYRLSFCRAMKTRDIRDMVLDFGRAADYAQRSGFDAIEVHAGHGYLLSQFLSPYTNKRSDGYGGSLEHRMRFPSEVMHHLREILGPDYPILVKINLRDGMHGGLELDESVQVARMFENAGASALVPSSGFTSKTPFLMLRGRLPIREMAANQSQWWYKTGMMVFGRFLVQVYPYSRLFHLEAAKKICRAVSVPVVYIGGIQDGHDIQTALESGFEFVQMGRALIRDPDFLKHLEHQIPVDPPCDHCNRCVAAMDGGGVYCVSAEQGFLRDPEMHPVHHFGRNVTGQTGSGDLRKENGYKNEGLE